MENVTKLCRACLSMKESFVYIFFQNVAAEIYSFCTSIEIVEDEDLPKALCNNCYELLTKYSEFKDTCIQSQKTLLDLKTKLKYEPHCTEIKYCGENEVSEVIKNEMVGDLIVKAEDETDLSNDNDNETGDYSELSDKILEHPSNLKKTKLKQHSSVKKETKKHFPHNCELCHKKFHYRERFEAHKLEHEGKMAVIHCRPCNKTFMTWSGLRRHNVSEHTIVSLESLKCTICGKIFKNTQTLKMHEKNHKERKLCVCHVCGKGFTTVYVLRTHLETHKLNRERRYACEHCGKKFFTKTTLLSHVYRRHSGRRFICQICSFPFTDKYNLTKHLLIHDGKKLYKCDICDKSYTTQSTLVEHKRIHSGERPYLCSYCPKSFLSKRRLDDHHRIHTGDKPHICGACGQGFTQRGTLKRHMKVHDRILPSIN